MPILIGLAGIALAVYFFVNRAKNAANIATELVDVANDVRLAARRFGFRRRSDLHPVESIEDPNLAIAAIATSFLELDDFPTQEHRTALMIQLQSQLKIDHSAAEELCVLGRWFMTECGGATPAIARLSRKLFRLNGSASFETLLGIVQKTLGSTGGTLNESQRDALDDIRRAFRLS